MSNAYPSKYHRVIFAVEKTHFWFRGRREMLQIVLSHFVPHSTGKTFLEVGFGTGELLPVISSLGFHTSGVDMNKEARICALERKIHASLYIKPFLQFTKKPFDAIGLFDVLEHQKNAIVFLRHVHECLSQNGLVFITVPAGQWLWSDMDRLSGHVRRYTKKEMERVLTASGFELVWWNYWNVFLLPLYAVWKAFGFISGKSDLTYFISDIHPVLNTLFFYSITIENKLMLYIPFLFGSSLVVVARKKRLNHDSTNQTILG